MKIKVEDRERHTCRIRSKLPFSIAKQRGSEMSVIHTKDHHISSTNCLPVGTQASG